MSLEAQLFNLIKTEKYPEALMLVKSTKELNINALDEEGYSLFMATIENSFEDNQKRPVFIEYLLVHPNFKQANTPINSSSLTPFEIALKQDDSTTIDLIIKHKDSKDIQVVFNAKDKLLYELQVQKIQRTQKRQDEKPSDSNAKTLDQQKEILESLLNTAVLHAIRTDAPSILQRLADAGAKLYYPLKDGTYPMDLVKNHPELKVHEWLSKYIKQQISSSPTFTLAAHGLARQHQGREQEIIAQQIKKTSENIQSLFKFFDYKEPQSNTSEQPKLSTPKKPCQ